MKTVGFTSFALLAVAMAMAFAAASVEAASRFPVLFLGALLLGCTLMVLVPARGPDSEFLLRLVLFALAVRLVLFGAIRLTVGPYLFAPDQLTYEIVGMELVRAWSLGLPVPRHAAEGLQSGYYLFNGALFRLFGEARSAPAILNVFMGAWLPVVLYATVLRVVRRNRHVARLSALLVAFFPSLVLWSVLNIREAPTILAIALAVYGAVRLQERWGAAGVLSLLLGATVLAGSREYLMVLVCGACAMALLVRRARAPAIAVLGGVALLSLLTLALQTSGVGGTLVVEPSLGRIQALRADLALGAASAYGQGHDVSTLSGALSFLPNGFAHFVFAPFPWRVGSVLQAVTLPETILWYALFPFVLWGGFLGLRHDPRGLSVVLSVLFVVVLAYSLVEGNVGTAYRHRAQVLPLFLVFAAIGLTDVYGLHRERAARRSVTRPVLTPVPR